MAQATLNGKKINETTKQTEHILEKAEEIARSVVRQLEKYTDKIDIVGSIRRRKQIVHDIDLVVIAKPHFFNSGVLKLRNVKVKRRGNKIIEIEYNGIQIDINLCNHDTYETLKLIKTGSTEHNKMLCIKAIQKCMHLYAGGQGLYKGHEKIADTEEGILKELLGKVPSPEERI